MCTSNYCFISAFIPEAIRKWCLTSSPRDFYTNLAVGCDTFALDVVHWVMLLGVEGCLFYLSFRWTKWSGHGNVEGSEASTAAVWRSSPLANSDCWTSASSQSSCIPGSMAHLWSSFSLPTLCSCKLLRFDLGATYLRPSSVCARSCCAHWNHNRTSALPQ